MQCLDKCNPYNHRSNCHKDIAEILRNHYQKPYFLPEDSESSQLDWIFMGGSGRGAFTHVSMNSDVTSGAFKTISLHVSMSRNATFRCFYSRKYIV